MQRDPYITMEGTQGMKGMAQHLEDDVEAYKERQGPAPRTPQTQIFHKYDAVGQAIGGMPGETVEGLLAHCLKELGRDPGITAAFKEMMMVARLSASVEHMEPYDQNKNHRLAKIKKAEEEYRQRLKDWEQSLKRCEDNYAETLEALKIRWERVLKSLRAAASKNPDLTTMATVDQAVFQYLNKKGYVTIRGNIITDICERLDNPSTGLLREMSVKISSLAQVHKASRAQAVVLRTLAAKKPKAQIVPPEGV